MWTPVEINALPTATDLINAKSAIEQVEVELNGAHLAQDQLQIGHLENDLRERRAWIAPVRRLNFDILSLIFEFCGEDYWRTPLRIARVSRQWRDTVLATPRAWAFLHIRKFGEEKLRGVETFLRRSGQHSLHVFLPSHYPSTLLSSIEGRVKCLSIKELKMCSHDGVFIRLERLRTHSTSSPLDLSYLSTTRFPSLRDFECKSVTFITQSTPREPIPNAFPPLRSLSVTLTQRSEGIELLDGCKNSLISLRLYVSDCTVVNKRQLLLPALKYLEIYCTLDDLRLWPLDLKTPVLEVYLERSIEPRIDETYHGDIGNVTHLLLDKPPTLSSFPLLEYLQIEQFSVVPAVISQLLSDQRPCPHLAVIELARFARHLGRELEKVISSRSYPVRLVVAEYYASHLPFAIVDYPCGKNMPCSGES